MGEIRAVLSKEGMIQGGLIALGAIDAKMRVRDVVLALISIPLLYVHPDDRSVIVCITFVDGELIITPVTEAGVLVRDAARMKRGDLADAVFEMNNMGAGTLVLRHNDGRAEKIRIMQHVRDMKKIMELFDTR
jgi:hypothetical protein